MMGLFLKQTIVKNRNLMAREAAEMGHAVGIIRRRAAGGAKLTKEEMAELKSQVKRSAIFASSLVLIVLPFGLLFFPFYTELIYGNRRKKI
jgi:hypothetical protein